MSSFLADVKTIYNVVLKPIRGDSHQDRLESFYEGQAEHYDSFRERLLKGRQEMILSAVKQASPTPTWADLGGGTGANLKFAKDGGAEFEKVYLLDLSPSLLEVAKKRCADEGLNNVELLNEDVTASSLPSESVDLVSFSYSLTMIPNWFSAMEEAKRILKPGGTIGVVDFYVSRKYPEQGQVRHPWHRRNFWSMWFASDNVFLSPDHLPYLQNSFEQTSLEECHAALPYFPGSKVPYYIFLGKKES